MKKFLRLCLFIAFIVCAVVFIKNKIGKKEKSASVPVVEKQEPISFERNFFGEKQKVQTKNNNIYNIFKNYDTYKFDASYTYNNLPNEKSELDRFNFYITKGAIRFKAEGEECAGIAYYYPDMIIVISDDKAQWLDTNLTISDKALIHEVAHIYADLNCGSRKHADDWVYSVGKVLNAMGLTDKALWNDIINEYGYKK